MESRGVDPTPRALRGPWEGENKIVLGIDIGTTQSGVAFTYLQTGAGQLIHRVKRWPGQEAQNEKGKIPTLVFYDGNKPMAFGAETLLPDTEEKAEDNNWVLAKHFKLHLHPADMKRKHDLKLDKLPPGVPIRQVYCDFMKYLLKHTKTYFEDCILDGQMIWERYYPTMEVVLAHPNGWGIREQAFLREVAVDAGFVNSDEASRQIRFVTEAEASVHFCIHHTNLGSRLKPGMSFAVCDAGGSTVDTTLYSVISTNPMLKLEEKRASACVQAGAIFVDYAVEKHLHKTFTNANLPREEVKDYTKAGVKDFENYAKRSFYNENADVSIAVADSRFNNTSIRARRGRMTLSGSTVKEFFEICSKDIISSVDKQLKDLTVPYILLVGGFGDSPFIRGEFKTRYEPGSQITLSNDSTSKAVADGAVIWSLLSSVYSRAPRYSFGVICARPFIPWLGNNDGREFYLGASGLPVIPGAWSQIVQKGVALDSEAIRRESYSCHSNTENPDSDFLSMDLYSYSGDDEPDWAWDRAGDRLPDFRKVCTVNGDSRSLQGALERKAGLGGKVYWALDLEVCIRFGGTELEAHVEWEENGVTRRGPAVIVPEDPIEL